MDLPIKVFLELFGFQFRARGKGPFRNVGEWRFGVCVCVGADGGGVVRDTCLRCPCMFGPVSTHAHTLAAVPQITRLFLTYMGYRGRGGGGTGQQ